MENEFWARKTIEFYRDRLVFLPDVDDCKREVMRYGILLISLLYAFFFTKNYAYIPTIEEGFSLIFLLLNNLLIFVLVFNVSYFLMYVITEYICGSIKLGRVSSYKQVKRANIDFQTQCIYCYLKKCGVIDKREVEKIRIAVKEIKVETFFSFFKVIYFESNNAILFFIFVMNLMVSFLLDLILMYNIETMTYSGQFLYILEIFWEVIHFTSGVVMLIILLKIIQTYLPSKTANVKSNLDIVLFRIALEQEREVDSITGKYLIVSGECIDFGEIPNEVEQIVKNEYEKRIRKAFKGVKTREQINKMFNNERWYDNFEFTSEEYAEVEESELD